MRRNHQPRPVEKVEAVALMKYTTTTTEEAEKEALEAVGRVL